LKYIKVMLPWLDSFNL